MRLVYTKPALDRIAEIQVFWAALTSEENAEAIVSSLMEKTRRLCEQPLRGLPERKLTHLGKGHRSFLLGRYKIIYYVHDDEVRVTDFFDTRQHPSRMRG